MLDPLAHNEDERRVHGLLSLASLCKTMGARMEVLSGDFLCCPYENHPLSGSATSPETFTASLSSFDCVTYIETILALARSMTVADFCRRLRFLRYENGRVEWRLRNHYMTGWIRNNVAQGSIAEIRAGRLSVLKTRILSAVPGLPPRRVRFAAVPKANMKTYQERLRTGDIIFFISTRKDLDVFHCGILVETAGNLAMRHAARSQGGVVEQDLREFMKQNQMSGLIAVRPVSELLP